ncbi:CAMK family protein kinase [Tritrichomonas foetus]|uniref:CAMK family protein kinase n=1 Tax=Tritrichomonas foetus TaxID=1144522 RepID=A0A1J4K7M6_9EUKA|nr:CAMK family protein kinase [Tritrichomonas foetus]|eukprot:OHT05716.1 CAMK family protein kinase [Tritrichomonas foetus]
MNKKNDNPFAGVDLRGYKAIREIARTSSSNVLIAQSPMGQYCCLKLVRRPNDNQVEAQFFQSEANALSILNNKTISPIKDFFYTETYYAVISEIRKGGSLQLLLEKRQFVGAEEAQNILFSIATALQYCHVRNVAHRDVKPSNILFEQDKVFLSDFGIRQIEITSHTYNSSIPYKAPELLEATTEKIDERPGDIWSLGVVLYEMITGKLPWNVNQPEEFPAQIKKGNFSFPPQVPQMARDLISKMMDMSPAHRISSHEILAHAWLSKIRKSSLRAANGKSVFSRSIDQKPSVRSGGNSKKLLLGNITRNVR